MYCLEFTAATAAVFDIIITDISTVFYNIKLQFTDSIFKANTNGSKNSISVTINIKVIILPVLGFVIFE